MPLLWIVSRSLLSIPGTPSVKWSPSSCPGFCIPWNGLWFMHSVLEASVPLIFVDYINWSIYSLTNGHLRTPHPGNQSRRVSDLMVNCGYSTVPSSNRSTWVTMRFRITIISGCTISLRFSQLQLARSASIGLQCFRWWVGVITRTNEICRSFKWYYLVESPSPIVSLLCLRVVFCSMWLLRFTCPYVNWIGWLDYAWRWSSWS